MLLAFRFLLRFGGAFAFRLSLSSDLCFCFLDFPSIFVDDALSRRLIHLSPVPFLFVSSVSIGAFFAAEVLFSFSYLIFSVELQYVFLNSD